MCKQNINIYYLFLSLWIYAMYFGLVATWKWSHLNRHECLLKLLYFTKYQQQHYSRLLERQSLEDTQKNDDYDWVIHDFDCHNKHFSLIVCQILCQWGEEKKLFDWHSITLVQCTSMFCRHALCRLIGKSYECRGNIWVISLARVRQKPMSQSTKTIINLWAHLDVPNIVSAIWTWSPTTNMVRVI